MPNKILFLFGLLTLFFTSCDTSNDSVEFDRTEFLTQYADELIIPTINSFSDKLNSFRTGVNSISFPPSEEDIQSLRADWLALHSDFISINTFSFGPAGRDGLIKPMIEEVGAFPPLTQVIEDKIENQEFSTDDSFRKSRGLLALEYLLYSPSDVNQYLEGLTSSKWDYFVAVTNHLHAYMNPIKVSWDIGGYRQVFIENDGTNVQSSTAQCYNTWLKSFESLRDLKLGDPMAFSAGFDEINPLLFEAYYSNSAIRYLKEHFNRIIYIWGGDLTSDQYWVSYLKSVDGGETLVESVRAEVSTISDILDSIPEDIPLDELVNSHSEELNTLHQALQEITHYFEGDMSSLLNIPVTFDTDDGDGA